MAQLLHLPNEILLRTLKFLKYSTYQSPEERQSRYRENTLSCALVCKSLRDLVYLVVYRDLYLPIVDWDFTVYNLATIEDDDVDSIQRKALKHRQSELCRTLRWVLNSGIPKSSVLTIHIATHFMSTAAEVIRSILPIVHHNLRELFVCVYGFDCRAYHVDVMLNAVLDCRQSLKKLTFTGFKWGLYTSKVTKQALLQLTELEYFRLDSELFHENGSTAPCVGLYRKMPANLRRLILDQHVELDDCDNENGSGPETGYLLDSLIAATPSLSIDLPHLRNVTIVFMLFWTSNGNVCPQRHERYAVCFRSKFATRIRDLQRALANRDVSAKIGVTFQNEFVEDWDEYDMEEFASGSPEQFSDRLDPTWVDEQ